MTGQSIFAHSRSNDLRGILPLLLWNKYFLSIGKIMPLKHHVLSLK